MDHIATSADFDFRRYYAFLDQTQAPRILADGIRDAYVDLFEENINSHY